MMHDKYRMVGESQKEGVTEQLKAENQMLWIAKMNNIRNRATKIVKGELIYS
ncbi:MAG: TnpV protein [Clostridia bacterium]|nr:TnpV protein [Clostridia bacterium]